MEAYVSKLALGQTCYVRVGNTIIKTQVETISLKPSPNKYISGDTYIVNYHLKGLDKRYTQDQVFESLKDLKDIIAKELRNTISIKEREEDYERY